MKLITYTIAAAFLAILAVYGYAFCVTDEGFFLQGYAGALLPAALGGWLFAAGWILGRK